jgi:uncharacterized coiled-coil protein SlyX
MIALLERRLAQTEDRIDGLEEHRDELRAAIGRLREKLVEPAAQT